MKLTYLLYPSVFWAFFLAAFACVQAAPDSQSGIYRIKIGDVDFYSIQDAANEMNTNALLTEDKEALKRLAPTGKAPSGYAVFVVKKGADALLIDTGVGGKMLEHLQTIGIKPEDVKNILLTHSHGDHIGGLVKDGKKVFSNATLWLTTKEWTFWKAARNKRQAEVCAELYGEPKFLTADETTAVFFPELTAVDLPGHTPGHAGFLLSSNGKKLLVVADLLHNGAVQFARPDISIQYDADPEQAAATRIKTLRRVADESIAIAGSHLPFPSVGNVSSDGGGFRFTPAIEEPAPGKQVAQVMELPAATADNRRPRLSEVERAAEGTRRNALTQEQRDAEDKERRMERFTQMRNPKPLSETETQTISYLLYLPKDYDAKNSEKYPLLLFLHGSGERGIDINKVKVHGPPKLLTDPEKAKDWPFITVSPQCPEGYSWSPLQLAKLLDEVEKKYAVDKNRIYVTGLSMGGFGTWGLLYNFPQRFAAGVPICGGFDPAAAEKFVDVPIWVFHGAQDTAVKVEWSIDVVNAIKEKGGKQIELTVYPELGHDSWTETYENPELYRWLLKQKKSD